jgi:hypothetical protein
MIAIRTVSHHDCPRQLQDAPFMRAYRRVFARFTARDALAPVWDAGRRGARTAEHCVQVYSTRWGFAVRCDSVVLYRDRSADACLPGVAGMLCRHVAKCVPRWLLSRCLFSSLGEVPPGCASRDGALFRWAGRAAGPDLSTQTWWDLPAHQVVRRWPYNGTLPIQLAIALYDWHR